jgi:CBS domain containing-hemolysin-like protein
LRDEFDEIDDSDPVRMAAASTAAESLLLEGSTTLRDLSTRLGWEFPRRPGVETLAGFLLAELGHIPVVGERVLHDRREFLIVDMAGRRISKVRVEERRAGVNTGTAGEAQATEDDGLEVSA